MKERSRKFLDKSRRAIAAARLLVAADDFETAASRAYYAMFQAAQIALRVVRVERTEWTHGALQAAFVTELIRRRKVYPAAFADYLSSGLHSRQLADYSTNGVSRRVAQRLVRRAATLVSAVQKEVGGANQSEG